MTWHLYIVPVARVDLGPNKEYEAPKYFWSRMTDGLPLLQGARWYWDVCAWEERGVVAVDLDDAQHALLSGQPDVIGVPALDNTIPNATVRNRVRNILEAGNLPGTWVNTGMSYRQVARTVLNVVHFFNRYVSKGGRLSRQGITLNTTWAQLPAAAQARLLEAANEFGLDTTGLTGTTTMRQILKNMADQFGDIEYRLGGLVI